MTPSQPKPRSASPFVRLAALIAGSTPAETPIDLALGEPRHGVPGFVGPILAARTADFSRYPPQRGTPEFRAAVAAWTQRRYGVTLDSERQVIALAGSREGLFTACMAASAAKPVARPVVLVPNPYYQAYGAAAPFVGAEIVPLPATAGTGFLPDFRSLDADLLARTVCAYLASPANPQGAVADMEYLTRLVALAREHGFMLFADECYSEIYSGAPPPGVLQAAGTAGFDRIVAFNSLSKRSNLAGLRVGWASGDQAFLDTLMELRGIAAPTVPIPALEVGAAALADEAHVEASRALYVEKFRMAQDMLGAAPPAGGFFLWLDARAHGGGEALALRLWREAGVKTLPGGYLGRAGPDGVNPGENHLRVALVADVATTREALTRMARLVV